DPAAECLDHLGIAMHRQIGDLAAILLCRLVGVCGIDGSMLDRDDECAEMANGNPLDLGLPLRFYPSPPAPQLLLVPAHGVVGTLRPTVKEKALDRILDFHRCLQGFAPLSTHKPQFRHNPLSRFICQFSHFSHYTPSTQGRQIAQIMIYSSQGV